MFISAIDFFKNKIRMNFFFLGISNVILWRFAEKYSKFLSRTVLTQIGTFWLIGKIRTSEYVIIEWWIYHIKTPDVSRQS